MDVYSIQHVVLNEKTIYLLFQRIKCPHAVFYFINLRITEDTARIALSKDGYVSRLTRVVMNWRPSRNGSGICRMHQKSNNKQDAVIADGSLC